MSELLKVENLKTQFKTESGLVRAVDGVSYHINEQEIVGVVGESGCGKSTLARTILRLIPATSGSVLRRGLRVQSGRAPVAIPQARSRAPRAGPS